MPFNKLKTQNDFSFLKRNLKFEDKIILGIGTMFFISLLIFISFANRAFNHIENQNKKMEKPIQTIQPIQSVQTKQTPQGPSRVPFLEENSAGSEEAFRRLERKFKENQAKRDASFNEIEKNFKERFKKAAEARAQRRKRLHKWFYESTARSSEEFDKKAVTYGAGLSNYAHGTSKEKKNDSHK